MKVKILLEDNENIRLLLRHENEMEAIIIKELMSENKFKMKMEKVANPSSIDGVAVKNGDLFLNFSRNVEYKKESKEE